MAPPCAGKAHWAASAHATSPRSSARWAALGCPRRGALAFFIGHAARADRRDRQRTRLAPCIPTPQSVICELIREGVRYRGIPLSQSVTPTSCPSSQWESRWIILTRIFRCTPFRTDRAIPNPHAAHPEITAHSLLVAVCAARGSVQQCPRILKFKSARVIYRVTDVPDLCSYVALGPVGDFYVRAS
ncbi:hypothetical protein DFH09DRAFT_1195291 [Mycena vulgaris]|nr:hypothetical protein DFH09DRAFT_1195291 [Mycena vulgaris]